MLDLFKTKSGTIIFQYNNFLSRICLSNSCLDNNLMYISFIIHDTFLSHWQTGTNETGRSTMYYV